MNFAVYRDLLRIRSVRTLLIVGMIARFPHSAAGVLLTLHVVQTLDRGYAEAGAVAAVVTIGIAVGAPWRGRRIDSAGLRRALIPSVIAEAVIWSVAPHLPYPWLLVAALVGGLFTLPAFSVIRQALGVLVEGDRRRTAFTLDAISTEMVFMAGPAVGVVLATQVSTVLGLTLVGVATASAGLFLMWFNPPTRSEQLPDAATVPAAAPAGVGEAAADLIGTRDAPTERLARHTLLRRGVRRALPWLTFPLVIVMVIAAGAGLVLSGTEVGIVAALEISGDEGQLGLVFVAWCAASVVGGLLYGALHRPVPPSLLLLGMALLTVPLAFADSTLELALFSIPAGLLCAPVLSAASEKVADLVAEDRRGEAMGWYGSALTSGVALGAPLAGVLIDVTGPWGGFTAVAVVSSILGVVGFSVRNIRQRPAPTAALHPTR
ncbi:MFS transporter [Arthrobacter agilis]|uniref:MFS transporter n=1 Tax=Arthrobacter agilis TaxID=37921 RepID=UPI000B362AA3|nr:MFS transporter [Arthrobacter agilis]OUM40335.1 MFS transporter [Arthrobacter agilis]PPB44947.1 MFS transporter [Arthrobacter agilis]TPV27652.1 MFS transporter [Arthrobacter agilis]VDR31721.1 multidrug resistance protein [Arthrobacter agilis]